MISYFEGHDKSNEILVHRGVWGPWMATLIAWLNSHWAPVGFIEKVSGWFLLWEKVQLNYTV